MSKFTIYNLQFTIIFVVAIGAMFLFLPAISAAKEEQYYFFYQSRTLPAAISQLNLTIYPEDKTHTFPEPKFGIGGVLTINRAPAIKVVDGNNEIIYRTWQTKLDDFLKEKNIELGANDKIAPPINTEIKDNDTIKITRVAITEIKEKEKISYKTINQDDAGLDRGKTVVKQEGKEGTREKIYQVTRENGKEVKRQLISNKVIKEPQDKIIIHGTKEVVLGTGRATWYDWVKGNTAAHNTLPYGTMVRVTNLANGKSVVVKIIDHGIFGSAIIDLSKDAFTQIGNLRSGVIDVKITKE